MHALSPREQILEVASRLFLQRGFSRTTVEDIAQLLGRAKGGLYYYFKNKLEILEELLRREVELFKKEVEEAAGDVRLSPEERVREVLRVFIRALPRMHTYRLARREPQLRHIPSLQNVVSSVSSHVAQVLTGLLEQGMHRWRWVEGGIEEVRHSLLLFLRACELLIEEAGKEVEDRLTTLASSLSGGMVGSSHTTMTGGG